MAELRLTRKEFLSLSMGAGAVVITGCPADDTGGDSTSGTTEDVSATTPSTSNPTTSPSTSATTMDTSTTEPDTGSGSESGSESGSGSGSETGSGSGSESGSGSGSETGSGSGSSSGSTADCSDGAEDTLITNLANHGHAVSIAGGELVAGTPLTGIDITGAALHSHTIDLSADDVDALLAGEEVTVTTNMDMTGHSHMVTVSC